MTITINDLVVEHKNENTMKDKVRTSVKITPNSVSPVLKTEVLINLESGFPFDLDKKHFTVNATSTKDEKYVRYLNVIKVNNDEKTLTCMFGGAWSGKFQMSIRHKDYGLVDTTGVILDVGSVVTSYSPNTGSIFGGTLLTIKGTNWGKHKTDNPV
jgi:hypothetical protein